jgi:anti-sigma B factor antagonist
MSLKLERRFYGSISIIRCTGVIVVGESLSKLEEELRRGVSETDRIVLDLSGVDRLDSTGMGLLVRWLSHIRNKGGDLRLCSPSQFVRKLLAATKLDTVFLVYTSDYNAIASFFVRGAPGETQRESLATVLFLDQSDDLCAFARSVLGQHGYEVLTTNCLSDAQLLVQAAGPDLILIGARMAEGEGEAAMSALQAAAPNAAAVTLPKDFGQSQPHHAAAALLKAVQHSKHVQA